MEIGIHSDESVINMVAGEDKPVDPDVIPMLSPITWTTTQSGSNPRVLKSKAIATSPKATTQTNNQPNY